jgi:hypothetical protein
MVRLYYFCQYLFKLHLIIFHMKFFSKLSLLCMIAAIILSACSNSSQRAQHVPAEAVVVFKLNTMQIGKKVAWESLTSGALFRDKDTTFDIEKTGIDMLNVFYAYGVGDQRLSNKLKMVFVLPLKSADKWESFLKTEFPNATVKQEGDYKFAHQDESVAGWNKNTLIVAIDAGGRSGDETTIILTEEIKKAFALKKDQSIVNNAKFAALEKEAHDVSFFLNYELAMDNIPQAGMSMAGSLLATQRKYLKDSYLAAGLDFDKGKIIADMRYYSNDNTMQLVKSLTPEKVDNDMLKRISGNQLNGVLAYHFNTNGVQALIDTMGYTGLINSQLEQVSLTIDEILGAFTGDLMLAATDVRMENKTQTYNYDGEEISVSNNQPTADFLFAMKIKNQATVNKILQLIAQEGGALSPAGPDMYISDGMLLSVKDGFVSVSNNEKNLQAFINNAGANFKIPNEVAENPYSIFIDINKSLAVVPIAEGVSAQQAAVLTEGKNLMEHLIGYGGKINGDHVGFHMELTLQNKNDNSLMQIIKYVEKLKKAEEAEEAVDTYQPEPAI